MSDARVESTLDSAISAFLVQLSIALHKSAAYPPRHPMVAAAAGVALKALGQLFRQRPTLALGVARNQLIIEGVATDPAHPVLRELAQRLYRHQVGGVTFVAGIEQEEFGELLRALSRESREDNPPEALPQWTHVRLHPLAFDQLRLAADAERGEAVDMANLQRLWSDLAGSALGREAGDESGPVPLDPGAVAREIDAHAAEPEYAQRITRQLVALAREGGTADAAEGRRPFSRQLTDLLTSLKPESLRWLLTLGPDASERDRLALAISRAMPIDAVVDLVRASSDAKQRTISHSLLRIFAKLAAHAEPGGPDVEADGALREMVRDLLSDWALQDPNPVAYGAMLEGLVRPGVGRGAARAASRQAERGESLRLVQMALELGTTGQPMIAAVDALVEQQQTPAVLNLLAHAPPGDPAAEVVWARLPARDELRRLLQQDEPDPILVDRLLRRLGIEAAEPLLDALAEADSRPTRRRLLTWLAQLGTGIGPMILGRLDSPHWYVLRNMLVLLGGIDPWPEGFSPAEYLVHPDARVRREALKLALRVPGLRDQAICTGLTDGDDLILRTALAAALDGCPAEAAPLLIDLVESRGQAVDVRIHVVRVLGTLSTPATRDCLIRRALARHRWLPGRRLAPKSPELVAAIGALSARWPEDPAARNVLRLAAKSADPEIRAALGPAGG